MNARLTSRLRAGILVPVFLLLALAAVLPAPAVAQTPLGATITGGSVQFAVFSQNATRIEVWIFSTPTASTPTATYALTKTDAANHIWTVTVCRPGRRHPLRLPRLGPQLDLQRDRGPRAATSASSPTPIPTATASIPTSC